MTTMNPEVKKKWVTRLRRTKKTQGKQYLGTLKGQRCCLGILCDLAVEAKVIPKPTVVKALGIKSSILDYGDDIHKSARVLPQSVSDWAGLEDDNPMIDKFLTASAANDSRGMSFKEIANLIEENL